MSTVTCVAAAPPRAVVSSLDHVSFSSLKTYQTCPRKFAFKYMEHAEEEFTGGALVFGGAFHRAVEHVHEKLIEGSPVPDADTLLNVYDESWQLETTGKPEVVYAKDEDAGTMRETAKRMLAAYRDHVVTTNVNAPTQIIAIEHSHQFRLLADVPPIEMRLDLLELRGGDLIVTDVKTSRSRWNDAKVAESLPQLILYAHGLVPLLKELGAKRIVPRFVAVTKGKTPVVQVLEPQASQADADKLKRTVRETWDAIQKEVFVPREGWHCAQCPFRRQCLGR
ncbi:MAG: PD-(D/E)XK nuclease family protein [Planctomycetota bacterium]